MAGDLKLQYATDAAFSETGDALNTLATSSTNVAGWSTASINNTTTEYVDILITGQFTVSGTAPTAGKSIKVYAYSSFNDTPSWPDLFSSGTEGSEGAATVHDEEQRDCGMRFLWAGTVDAGISEVYVMPPTSLAMVFGGIIPPYVACWVVQDTGQALAAGELHYIPVHYQYT